MQVDVEGELHVETEAELHVETEMKMKVELETLSGGRQKPWLKSRRTAELRQPAACFGKVEAASLHFAQRGETPRRRWDFLGITSPSLTVGNGEKSPSTDGFCGENSPLPTVRDGGRSVDGVLMLGYTQNPVRRGRLDDDIPHDEGLI
jgi:hypothetical protein